MLNLSQFICILGVPHVDSRRFVVFENLTDLLHLFNCEFKKKFVNRMKTEGCKQSHEYNKCFSVLYTIFFLPGGLRMDFYHTSIIIARFASVGDPRSSVS